MKGELSVVVGASGGIGRALIDGLCDIVGHDHVIALSRRRPTGWRDALDPIWLEADILDEESLASAAVRIAAAGSPVRVIIASGRLSNGAVGPEKSLRDLNAAALMNLFQVNAIGPALAAKHLLPLMSRDRRSVFAVLSARVGSIGENAVGGWYSYRAAKAALNMILRTAAIEHRRTHPQGICVAVHPGTVATPLSLPFLRGSAKEHAFAPASAASNIIGLLDQLKPEANGSFYAWDGTVIPW